MQTYFEICSHEGRPLRLSGNPQVPTAKIKPYVMSMAETCLDYCTLPRGLSIGFVCQRFLDEKDEKVKEIYQKIFGIIIQNEFQVNEQCLVGQDKEHCGNFRGYLNECRCGPLDRKSNPHLRKYFEDCVIRTIHNQALNHFPTLNIAIFASGHLHGELVLMVRLIEYLKVNKYKGEIKIFLIDTIYKDSIQKAYEFTTGPQPNQSFKWHKFIGNRLDLEQFLHEITLGLPSTITVTGEVFGLDDDYILRAQQDQDYQCDLVIGADTETNGEIMGKIKAKAQRTNILGIALEKYQGIPQVCQINNRGVAGPCQMIG